MTKAAKYLYFNFIGKNSIWDLNCVFRQQGKNYTVEDGDIIHFKFNAGAGLTAAKKKWAKELMVWLLLCQMI